MKENRLLFITIGILILYYVYRILFEFSQGNAIENVYSMNFIFISLIILAMLFFSLVIILDNWLRVKTYIFKLGIFIFAVILIFSFDRNIDLIYNLIFSIIRFVYLYIFILAVLENKDIKKRHYKVLSFVPLLIIYVYLFNIAIL